MMMAAGLVLSNFAVPANGFFGQVLQTEVAEAASDDDGGKNVDAQNYSWNWSAPMTSFLTITGQGYMSVRYMENGGKGKIRVSYYDTNFHISEKKDLGAQLPLWGGFYDAGDAYYIVTGQENKEERETAEVYRITKYDRNWKELGSASVYGANTTVPFDAGCCRMAMQGNTLAIRTCHKMYTSSDGLNHQASVLILVDTDRMDVADAVTNVANTSAGYVSHSFNQFVQFDGSGRVVTLDHGDAYPRGLVICRSSEPLSEGKLTGGYQGFNRFEAKNVVEFDGQIGNNQTGYTAGGFELSRSGYLAAGSGGGINAKTKNIFVVSQSEDLSKQPSIHWITNYSEGEASASTPQLVKLSDEKFLLLWDRENKVYWTEVDAQGNAGQICSHEGNLSDCKPVAANGQVAWYTVDGITLDFYTISLTDLSQCTVKHTQGGHIYEVKNGENGTAVTSCTVCGASSTLPVMSKFTVYWGKSEMGSYSTALKTLDSQSLRAGSSFYIWIKTPETDVNKELEIKVSDPTVLSYQVTKADDAQQMGAFTIKKEGKVRITVAPKWNQGAAQEFDLTIGNPKEDTKTGESKTDGTQADGTKSGGSQLDSTKTDGTKSGGSQSDGTKTDGTKSGGSQSDSTKTDGTKPGGSQSDGTKTDGTKTGGTQSDGTKTDSSTTDSQRQGSGNTTGQTGTDSGATSGQNDPTGGSAGGNTGGNTDSTGTGIDVPEEETGSDLETLQAEALKWVTVKWSKVTAGKKKITVKFKKAGISGVKYEIYYKTGGRTRTKKVSGTSVTISGLVRGKKYTLKVRAYKTIGGKTYYSKWSFARAVKVK